MENADEALCIFYVRVLVKVLCLSYLSHSAIYNIHTLRIINFIVMSSTFSLQTLTCILCIKWYDFKYPEKYKQKEWNGDEHHHHPLNEK